MMEVENTTHWSYGNDTSLTPGRRLFLHPFSDPVNRAIIIVSYSVVFLACIVGNVLVLFIVARNGQMRTRTNVFLANLAAADLCVGIFCIFPNMFKYLFFYWSLGKIMCKVFQFVKGMNLTASMLLLEVVAVERYVAINHSLKARRFFTRKNMYLTQIIVWVVSFVYNVPIFIMYNLHEYGSNTTKKYSFCYPDDKYQLPNNALASYDTITFVVWYVLPLMVMTFMYASMVNTLWKSTQPNFAMPSLNNCRHYTAPLCSSSQTGKNTIASGKNGLIATMTLRANKKKRYEHSLTFTGKTFESSPSKNLKIPTKLELLRLYKQPPSPKTDQTLVRQQGDMQKSPNLKLQVNDSQRPPLSPCASSNSSEHDPFPSNHQHRQDDSPAPPSGEPDLPNKLDRPVGESQPPSHNSTSSCGNISKPPTPLKNCRCRVTSQRASRRRVIRLLIVVLILFALLVFPHHLVLLLTSFQYSLGLGIFTGPLCDLAMFLNSAVNPVLYSLFSQTFRRNIKEVLHRCKDNRKPSKSTRQYFHSPVRRTGNIVDNPFIL